jgi:hypothetical protein
LEPPDPADLWVYRDQAAKITGTNPRYVQDAKAVKAASLALHEQVKNDSITLPAVGRECCWARVS